MGRHKSFKPEEALQKAMTVFLSKGFDETSYDELVAATGVARYGLYSTFGNKRDLFIKVLQHYRKTVTFFWSAGLDRDDADIKDVRALVKRMKDFAAGSNGTSGCLMCKTAVKGKTLDVKIQEEVEDYFSYFRMLFFRAFENSRAKALVPNDFDSEKYADFYVCMMRTADLLARTADPEHNYDGYFVISDQLLEMTF